MITQIDSEELMELRKNANDNKQIVKLSKVITFGIIFLVIYFTWIVNLCNVLTKRFEADILAQTTITQAQANVQAREIESDGLTNEEYFEWLKVRNTTDI